MASECSLFGCQCPYLAFWWARLVVLAEVLAELDQGCGMAVPIQAGTAGLLLWLHRREGRDPCPAQPREGGKQTNPPPSSWEPLRAQEGREDLHTERAKLESGDGGPSHGEGCCRAHPMSPQHWALAVWTHWAGAARSHRRARRDMTACQRIFRS